MTLEEVKRIRDATGAIGEEQAYWLLEEVERLQAENERLWNATCIQMRVLNGKAQWQWYRSYECDDADMGEWRDTREEALADFERDS